MSTDKTNQSWGGRFSEPVDAFVARFTASVTFDQRLYRHDIMGSIAHATMLAKVGVLTEAERDSIIDGLTTIRGEIEAGTFDWRVDLEDVHMNIEARLTDRIGVTGKKLHTGRSRNDQVATDIRLWLRDEIDLILSEITRLQKGLLRSWKRKFNVYPVWLSARIDKVTTTEPLERLLEELAVTSDPKKMERLVDEILPQAQTQK
jgi:argininosuccinate lyase